MINYRAIHTKTLWRKVSNHQTLEAAINGKDGAAGLFAGKVRIDYEKHGDPLYVVIWESDALTGLVIKPIAGKPGVIRKATVPVSDLMVFEENKQAGCEDLERYFRD